MDVLPIVGDHVRVPVGPGTLCGFVANTSATGREPMVTIEIHLPDVEPYTATFPMKYVEPVEATDKLSYPLGVDHPKNR